MFDTCAERQLCLIAFLPHILDSMAAGRNGYIETLLTIAERYKQRPFGCVCVCEERALKLSILKCNTDGYGLKVAKIPSWRKVWMLEDLVTQYGYS